MREQVESHENEIYFILKSIIVENLYGVDIMEEAVEICKLRLFLKLVAQLETYEQIEPLPDIDFNVRAGNTLVGFASLDEVRKALEYDMFKDSKLLKIEERASAADQAFSEFQSIQTLHESDATGVARAKSVLRERLTELRTELDGYLANEYNVGTANQEAYEQWRESHHPFHWFVEFYGIMEGGGFDVIIGNPPYVEYTKVKNEYSVRGYSTESCGNLYAFILERCRDLSNPNSQLSMIVPLSGHSTKRMTPLINRFYRQFNSLYLFNISADANPSVLFPGVKFRLAIFIASNTSSGVFTTGYSRWYAEERNNLFSLLRYIDIGDMQYDTAIPKISDRLHYSILKKVSGITKDWHGSLSSKRTAGGILYHSAPVNWIRAHTKAPYFHSERDSQHISGELKFLYMISGQQWAGSLQGILCSTTFFISWISHSDCYHLNRPEIYAFPMFQSDQLNQIAGRLEDDMQAKTKRRVYHYRTTGRVEYDEFYMKMSKSIIDEIDRVLAEHFGFTEEELDFIINYDIKYRIGR